MDLNKLVKKTKSMSDLSEMLIGSVMVTRMNGDFGSEWKFSPYGLESDYDRDCYWSLECELEDVLTSLLNQT